MRDNMRTRAKEEIPNDALHVPCHVIWVVGHERHGSFIQTLGKVGKSVPKSCPNPISMQQINIPD